MLDARQPGEKVLYTSQDGKALVTNKRLLLGDEQWEISAITDADVEARKKLKFHWWLKLNSQTVPNIVAAGVLFLVAFLFIWLAASLPAGSEVLQGLLVVPVLLCYLAAFIFIWRTWWLSLPTRYHLRLALQDPTGAASTHRTTYAWDNALEAREVEQAILQATSAR